MRNPSFFDFPIKYDMLQENMRKGENTGEGKEER